jgi:PAP2 superfamily protein
MAVARIARFTGFELVLWAGIYGAYLALRNLAIGSPDQAFSNAASLIDVERATGLFHEVGLQHLLAVELHLEGFFSLYYMVGFGPLIGAMLIFLGARKRDEYRQLRTWLLVAIAIASIGYLLLPTAPPRLVPDIGIADTVGLSSHDTGSVGGIRFNPYAAMPSMHVGWSLLVALIGFRLTRRRLVRALFVMHPIVMAFTVTVTGNHYFIDSIVGALVALAAVGLVSAHIPSRLRALVPAGLGFKPRAIGGPCSSH